MTKTTTSIVLTLVLLAVVMITGTIGQCPTANQFKVDGKCKFVECRNSDQCDKFKSSCSDPNQMRCLDMFNPIGKFCKCRGQWKGDRYGNGSCNYNLNGDSKCGKGEVCNTMGICVKGVRCLRIGQKCDNGKNRCCSNIWCQRGLNGVSSCQRTAQPGESCKSGIVCDGSSRCIKGKCSKRVGDACKSGDVCPPRTTCMSSQAGYRVYRNCACIKNPGGTICK